MRLIDADVIDDAPTVEAEPVRHGKWIDVDDGTVSCKCSVCGFEYHLYEDDINGYPYCAHCGAKMDAELIRCKDCKHWKNNIDVDEPSVCRLHGMFEGAADYCSRAERKEE